MRKVKFAFNTRGYAQNYAKIFSQETKEDKIEILEVNGIPKILCEVLEKIG